MHKSNKIPIYFDGVIFARNPTGGIARVFSNIIRNMLKSTGFVPLVYLPQGTKADWLPLENTVSYGKPVSLRPSRLFVPANKAIEEITVRDRWGKLKNGVFISTFYTTYSSLRIPQILFVHDLIFEKYPRFFGEELHKKHITEKKKCIEEATAIVCCSHNTENDLRDLFDTKDKILRVVPYGIGGEFVPIDNSQKVEEARVRFTGGHDYILHVGARRYPHKNFEGLLKAYSYWRRKNDVHILSVGGGPFSEKEQSTISRLGLGDKLHHIPEVSNRDLVLAYNAARACAVPSFCEGFGFPLLEAMACGIPVIASDRTSLPEIGGEIPEYFNPEDTASILRALENLSDLENNTVRLREGIRLAWSYSWENAVNSYFRLIKEITASPKNRKQEATCDTR